MAGDYFLVPQETVERGRVTEEQKVQLEQLAAKSDDVTGHSAGIDRLKVSANEHLGAGLIYWGSALVAQGDIGLGTQFIIAGINKSMGQS